MAARIAVVALLRPKTTPNRSAPTERIDAERCSFSFATACSERRKRSCEYRQLRRVFLAQFLNSRVPLLAGGMLHTRAKIAFGFAGVGALLARTAKQIYFPV